MSRKTKVSGEPKKVKPALSSSGLREVSPGETPRAKKRFDIDIFKGWCKCCGICAAFCPRECIRLDEEGSPFLEDPDRCTGCGWCELHCPDFAISVHERKAKRTEASED